MRVKARNTVQHHLDYRDSISSLQSTWLNWRLREKRKGEKAVRPRVECGTVLITHLLCIVRLVSVL